MFSSDYWCHLVFANDKDVFFTEDLLKLNLHQYLWLQLRKSGYEAVYFLDALNDNSGFYVTTFGDPQCKLAVNAFTGSCSSIKSTNAVKEFVKWSRQASAIVCPLDKFCKVVKDWENLLAYFNDPDNQYRRQGIILFTASCFAADNSDVLLKDPIAELVLPAIKNMRNAPMRSPYALLPENGLPTVFLNQYTKENLLPLLRRVVIENPTAFFDADSLELLAAYLADTLNRLNVPPAELKNLPALPTFNAIYDNLRSMPPADWQSLKGRLPPEQPSAESCQPLLILHRAGSVEFKCLCLKLPAAVDDVDIRKQMTADLNCIRACVISPPNSMQNEAVAANLTYLADLAPSSLNSDEPRVYMCLLQAIELYVNYLYKQFCDKPSSCIDNYYSLSDLLKRQLTTVTAQRQRTTSNHFDAIGSTMGEVRLFLDKMTSQNLPERVSINQIEAIFNNH